MFILEFMECIIQTISTGVTMYQVSDGEHRLNFKDVFSLWQSSGDFRKFYIDILSKNPYKGYFWEVKPYHQENINDPFEFVLVDSKVLPGLKANDASFSKYFKENKLVVSFPNLGNDAELIVPAALSEKENYAHLAKFVRNAPEDQVDEFWKTVGEKAMNSIGDRPKWLSTAGLGVYWLHVRIDTRPKYYRYQAYKQVD